MDRNGTSSGRAVALAVAVVGWLGPVALIPREVPDGRFLQGVGVVIWCAVALCVFANRVPAPQRTDRRSH